LNNNPKIYRKSQHLKNTHKVLKHLEKFPSVFRGQLISMIEKSRHIIATSQGGKEITLTCLGFLHLQVGVSSLPLVRSRCKNLPLRNLHIFRFMINFALWFTLQWVTLAVWGMFPQCLIGLGYALFLGPSYLRPLYP